MVERIVTIRNRAGMHARPAALLVKTASSFAAQISIEKDSERVNGKRPPVPSGSGVEQVRRSGTFAPAGSTVPAGNV